MVKPRGRRVTIKQVAQEVGVSTQTVSRVLNKRPDVAPQTRRQVLEAIEQLGYQPSALARSLIQRRSYTLGVVIAGLRHRGPSRTLNGITEQAESMGYSLLLKNLPTYDFEPVESVLNPLLAQQVDGIIWAVSEVGDNREWIDRRLPDLPVPVVFTTMHRQEGLAIVAFDNYVGSRAATEHLLAEGYIDIGFIAGPLAWWEVQQRHAGWRDALQAAGIVTNDRQWVEGNWSSRSGTRAFEQLLTQYPELDAVFAANDQMALGVINAAHSRNLPIPQNLGVAGFDGIPESAYFWPPLTTVQQDQEALGEIAVRKLVEMIDKVYESEDGYQPEMTWLDTKLVVRDSSRRDPGRG